MATKTFSATVGSDFLGNKIPEIKFDYEATNYASYSDVPPVDRLTEKDMLAVVNASEKASARAKKTSEVLLAAGYAKPDRDSEDFIVDQMVKLQMKLNKNLSADDARKIVLASQQASAAV